MQTATGSLLILSPRLSRTGWLCEAVVTLSFSMTVHVIPVSRSSLGDNFAAAGLGGGVAVLVQNDMSKLETPTAVALRGKKKEASNTIFLRGFPEHAIEKFFHSWCRFAGRRDRGDAASLECAEHGCGLPSTPRLLRRGSGHATRRSPFCHHVTRRNRPCCSRCRVRRPVTVRASLRDGAGNPAPSICVRAGCRRKLKGRDIRASRHGSCSPWPSMGRTSYCRSAKRSGWQLREDFRPLHGRWQLWYALQP